MRDVYIYEVFCLAQIRLDMTHESTLPEGPDMRVQLDDTQGCVDDCVSGWVRLTNCLVNPFINFLLLSLLIHHNHYNEWSVPYPTERNKWVAHDAY
jgi:hypothetical protein